MMQNSTQKPYIVTLMTLGVIISVSSDFIQYQLIKLCFSCFSISPLVCLQLFNHKYFCNDRYSYYVYLLKA